MTDITAVSGTRRAIKELVDGTIRVQVDIDPRFRRQFFDLFPDIDTAVALAPLSPQAAAAPSPTGQTLESLIQPAAVVAPNRLAEFLHISGYFRSPKLWTAMDAAGIYTEKQHKAYIETLSCVGWGHLECNGDVCLHHVKTAANSGVGYKPPHFYGVPLCFRHHRDWAHGTGSLCATRKDKQDLLERAVAITAENMKASIKSHLKIESLRELTLEKLHVFEDTIGLPITKWGGA